MSDRIGVALTPMETRREVIVETALLAESLGYEIFSLAEGWTYDSTAMLSFIAARTQRIRLLPGVLSVWSRTPAVLAMGAATLHEISGGRAILGLGTSTRALTEGLHDVAFMRPADQLRNVATQVRCLLDGQRATTAATGARPLRLGLTPTPELPIWIAATGDLTTQVVAEAADGWYPLFLTLRNLQSRGDEIARASCQSKPVTVAAGPFVVAGPGARDIAASCLAWYICAMGDGYAKLIADQGYGDAVEAIICQSASDANEFDGPRVCERRTRGIHALRHTGGSASQPRALESGHRRADGCHPGRNAMGEHRSDAACSRRLTN